MTAEDNSKYALPPTREAIWIVAREKAAIRSINLSQKLWSWLFSVLYPPARWVTAFRLIGPLMWALDFEQKAYWRARKSLIDARKDAYFYSKSWRSRK